MQDLTDKLVGSVVGGIGSAFESFVNVFIEPRQDSKKEKLIPQKKAEEQVRSKPSDDSKKVINNLSTLKNQHSIHKLQSLEADSQRTTRLSFESDNMLFEIECSSKIKFYFKQGSEEFVREFETSDEFFEFCIDSVKKYFNSELSNENRSEYSLKDYFDDTRNNVAKGSDKGIQKMHQVVPSAPPAEDDILEEAEGYSSPKKKGYPPVPSSGFLRENDKDEEFEKEGYVSTANR